MHWASSPSLRRTLERKRRGRSGLGSRRDWKDWRDRSDLGPGPRSDLPGTEQSANGERQPASVGSGPREGQPRAPSQKPPRRPAPDGPTGLPPHVSSERCLNLSETRKVGSGDLSYGGNGDTDETPRPLQGDPPARVAGWHRKVTGRSGVWAGPTGSSRDSVLCPRLTSSSPATRVLNC